MHYNHIAKWLLDRPARVFFLQTLALLLAFYPIHLVAQGYGSIGGTISDPTGAVIPSAKVTAIQTSTGRTTIVTTTGSGNYVFPTLPPSVYSLSVSAKGFTGYIQSGIDLQADQTATLDIKLNLGSNQQTVTFSANATAVDTTTGTLSSVIDTAQVNSLPLNGRNAAQLTTLSAGVVLAPNDGSDEGSTKTFPVAVTISANGSRSNQTNYKLDGGNNNDEYTDANAPFPFPDALQEFSVDTSNYNAEYGQNAGGVVNIITKSGGNAFHGDLFEYLRNGYFNAVNFFASTVDPLKRNQFGGTLGGPVKIPHLVSGKQTFFFFGYQKTIDHDQQGGQSEFVPTQANERGDFSALLSASNPDNPLGKAITIVNPKTGLRFPGNIIDPSLYPFDPAVVAFEKYLPSVTGDGLVYYQLPLIQGYDEYLARVDQSIGRNDHLFAHYYTDYFTNAGFINPANLLIYTANSNIRYQSSLISETHTFSPNLLNNIVVNYSREISSRGPVSGGPDAATFGVNIYQPPVKSINSIGASGFFSVGATAQATFERNNYTLEDDFHWVKGSHNIGFGIHAELSKFDIINQLNEAGNFSFNSNITNYALASMQLGYMGSFSQGSGQYASERNHFLGFYAQDIWKVSKRLTLDYGLRYEPWTPWSELAHRFTIFNPAAYAAGKKSTIYTNTPPGLLFPGDPGIPQQAVRSIYTHVMPRTGFALDVFGNAKTALRGGAGIFYDSRTAAMLNTYAEGNTPFSITVGLTQPMGPFSNPYADTTNPFPAPNPAPFDVAVPLPLAVDTLDPSGNFHVPLTYAWNLTVDQQVTPNTLARISYAASHSSHIITDIDLNPAPATSIPGSTVTENQRRPFANYTNIIEGNMGGNVSYNSLQASLQQRLSRGLRASLNYTWSKALDTLPITTTGNDMNLNAGQSYVYPLTYPNFRSLDYGPTDFDHRQVFSATYLYDLPKIESGPKLLRTVVNGWQVTGIVQAQSGDPISVTAGTDRSQTGLNQDRAELTGQTPYGSSACQAVSARCKGWLNPNAFALPALGSFGDVQKYSFRGPKYVDWDAGVIRSFPVRESAQFEFRAEYFNLLNHPNLADPVTSISNAGFGRITSTGTYQPRIAQFSGKFVF